MLVRSESFAPPESALRRIRASAECLEPDELNLVSWFRRYTEEQTTRLAFDLAMVEEEVSPGGRVLECGAAPYLLTRALATHFDLHGVDLEPERFATALARYGLSVVRCDIERERLPFEDDQFDAVLFNELFEHLRLNPIFTLTEVRRVLRPGGLLFLSTPNLRSLRGWLNFALKGKAYSCSGEVFHEYAKLEWLGHMGHVREYTTVEITDFLQAVGFSMNALVFRGQHRDRVERVAFRLTPRLRPFVTYVASK